MKRLFTSQQPGSSKREKNGLGQDPSFKSTPLLAYFFQLDPDSPLSCELISGEVSTLRIRSVSKNGTSRGTNFNM